MFRKASMLFLVIALAISVSAWVPMPVSPSGAGGSAGASSLGEQNGGRGGEHNPMEEARERCLAPTGLVFSSPACNRFLGALGSGPNGNRRRITLGSFNGGGQFPIAGIHIGTPNLLLFVERSQLPSDFSCTFTAGGKPSKVCSVSFPTR